MGSSGSPGPGTAPSRLVRGFAVLSASLVGAGVVGFAAGSAGAQGTGPGGLNVDAIQSSVDPAVAVVNTTLAGGRGQAAGTGMVISSSGEILTNNHVIENSGSVRVQIGGKGRSYPADVVGYNVTEDVALLKINGVSGLDAIKTADTVTVGEPIVALGNAGGRGGVPDASPGAVRGTGQTIQVADDAGGSRTLRNLIRIDATLQPGDSGGPLVDAGGDVVGMNTAASSGGGFRLRTGSSEGYAVPIKTAMTVANQIRSGQGSGDTHVGPRAFLGVSVQGLGQRGSRSGGSSRSSALVEGVQSNSPADNAGLHQGDTIVSLAGKSITSLDDLTSALAPHHPHDKVDIGWVDQNGNHHSAQVTLGSGPPA